MIGKLIILVFIEIIILYIGLRSWYIYYKKEEFENDKRMLVLEKRIEEYKHSLKNKKKVKNK